MEGSNGMPGAAPPRRGGFPALKRSLVSGMLPLALFATLLAPGRLRGEDAAFHEGRIHLREGRAGEAVRAFERALAEDPGHLEARYQLALACSRHVSTFDRAETELLRIPGLAMEAGTAARDDVIFRAGLQLGKLYLKSGQYGRAIQVLEGTIAASPPGAPLDEAYNNLGLAYYYGRLYEKAVLMFKNALKENPDSRNARFNLRTFQARFVHYQVGEIYSRVDDPESSIGVLSRAVEIDPRYVEARLLLGMELLKAGRSGEALREFLRAERASGKSYPKRAEIWHGQGMALAALGRTGESVERFRKAAGANLRFAKPHNELGKIYLAEGDFAAAIQSFAIAIQIDPKPEYLRNFQTAVRKLR